jgi:hypothetical protein
VKVKPMMIRGITLAAPRPLAEVDAGPAWMSAPDRQCAPLQGEIMKGFTSDDRKARHDAAKLCIRHCRYRLSCLERAIDKQERSGVWGGVDFDSESDRNAARDQLTAQRAAEQAVTADAERYGHEVDWLISRRRTNAQIANALHIDEDRVALIRARLDQRTAVAA